MTSKPARWLAGPTSAVALVGLPTIAAAQGQENGYYGHPGMGMNGWEGWFLGPFTMLAFVIVVVALIIFLVRWLGGGPTHGPRSGGAPGSIERPDRALDLLRERYAKGEINREEFEERRRTLLSD